ncbi:MAG TPA: GyrI-like domain-containing protein [Mobilitalea sp.]|nr:GyrI-like domain-containing protein [Mobilitalea sp.]
MNYEEITLAEKVVVGLSAKTSNGDPQMQEIIGGLWQRFYQEGINDSVKNKVNGYAIGLYSDYEADNYLVTVGNEVSKADNPGLSLKVIPAGRYAKFVIKGNMITAVADAWNDIWQMNLNRSFTGDFEEYLNGDMENAEINIYIALK